MRDMADEKQPGAKPAEPPAPGKPKFDPFNADTPSLPGVPQKKTANAAPPGFKLDFKDPKVMAGGGIGAAFLLLVAWMIFGSSTPPAPAPAAAPAAAAASQGAEPGSAASGTPAASASQPIPVVPIPGSVGTIEEFPQPWSVKKVFLQKATGRIPALIIRLPGGSPRRAESYWGVLLVSPYGRCELEYVEDLKKIADDYGYRAKHPMLVDPCNLTVFDPLRMGDVGGIVARGEAVQGTTIRPPLAVDLRIDGNRIMAMQTE